MYNTPAQWAKVSPSAVLAGSGQQALSVASPDQPIRYRSVAVGGAIVTVPHGNG